MNKKNYFSENLAYARKLNGFRQHELADWIGVRPNTISNYEKGVSEPDYDTLGKLKTFLDVSADDLVFAKPEKFKEVYVVVEPGTVPMYEVKPLKKRYTVPKVKRIFPVTRDNKTHLPALYTGNKITELLKAVKQSKVIKVNDMKIAFKNKKEESIFSPYSSE